MTSCSILNWSSWTERMCCICWWWSLSLCIIIQFPLWSLLLSAAASDFGGSLACMLVLCEEAFSLVLLSSVLARLITCSDRWDLFISFRPPKLCIPPWHSQSWFWQLGPLVHTFFSGLLRFQSWFLHPGPILHTTLYGVLLSVMVSRTSWVSAATLPLIFLAEKLELGLILFLSFCLCMTIWVNADRFLPDWGLRGIWWPWVAWLAPLWLCEQWTCAHESQLVRRMLS